MSSAEAKAAAVPESVLRKRKREDQWAADKKEKALADRKKALESRKAIFARAEQYAQEYDAQVSDPTFPSVSKPLPSCRVARPGCLRLVFDRTAHSLVLEDLVNTEYLADYKCYDL